MRGRGWVVLLLLVAAPLGAQPGEEIIGPGEGPAAEAGVLENETASAEASRWLEEALQAYRLGLEEPDPEAARLRFLRAAHLFEKVAETGHANAELHVNAGNAFLQAGRLGGAVLAYRRALRLDPDHPAARQNLAHARGQLPGWVPKPQESTLLDTFFFWHGTLSSPEKATAAALAFALAVILFALAIRTRRSVFRSLGYLPALVWLILLGSLVYARGSAESPAGVVVSDEVTLRAADSGNAPALFPEPFPGGTEIRILEERREWRRVRLANGREGWMRAGGIRSI